jgi:hypothetical protein
MLFWFPPPALSGMDFYVVLERAGYRVARRRRCKNKVGHQHKLTKEDAMKWFQQKFEGIILVRPARAPRPPRHACLSHRD